MVIPTEDRGSLGRAVAGASLPDYDGVSSDDRGRTTEDRGDLSSGVCHLFSDGGIAQLGERLLCKQEVIGSIPFASTSEPAFSLHLQVESAQAET